MSHRKDAKTQRRIGNSSTRPPRIIIDKAIVVHSKLGPGLLESVYRTCLAHELRKAGATRRGGAIRARVLRRELQLDDGYRLDMLVNDAVIVEIKTVETILPVHQAQLLSYLKLLDKRLGLLLNFKVPRLDPRHEASGKQLLDPCVLASSAVRHGKFCNVTRSLRP